jgi:tetratricopeptide (TPR) repeat protein
VAESSGRLAELERRVQFDPSPFVFAQLAEEYRRVHRVEDAITCCRAGLSRHPGYLLARLILGRTLAAASRSDEAIVEFERVVAADPDHLGATRELADLYERRGQRAEALRLYRRALALARNDRRLEAIIAALSESEPAADSDALRVDARVAPGKVDFDALLATLGQPDRQPPPLVETLLSDPLALVAPPGSSETPAATPDDPFGTLERRLRGRLAGAVPEPASTARPEERKAAIDAAVIAALEAWLDALSRDRGMRLRASPSRTSVENLRPEPPSSRCR